MNRYMMDRDRMVTGVHFEKGAYIVTTVFHIEAGGWFMPAKLTQLAQGFAVAGRITINANQVTYTEDLLRPVWYRLAEETGNESQMATADEVRPILIHREHSQSEGQYACDCGIDLQQAHVPAGTQIWRVEN